ncbi:putative membrane protein [Natronospira proteinivora]|uniref:Membrane protein n=1 Tax=Natronospira proteinivora TaxID=1807133 RepID=A0ABT1G5D9_9GAMM|nr:CopD family protein [Natronospira proteinivora]MCP1726297.1 putative membrane protein [Natronospira proteinivora]
MLHGLFISLHSLAAVIWVGGMFYAYMAMRPAVVARIEPAQRPGLWQEALSRFFLWVWIAVAVLLVSGHGLVALMGGWGAVGWHIHLMHAIGLLMMLIYAWVFFVPYRRLKRADQADDASDGGRQIPLIRRAVGINLLLGLITVAIASGGVYW